MMIVLIFIFNYTATTEIYTLSLHDALPIFEATAQEVGEEVMVAVPASLVVQRHDEEVVMLQPLQHLLPVIASGDRKSTRLNSSHANISYAVFCLKKKTFNQLPKNHNFPTQY